VHAGSTHNNHGNALCQRVQSSGYRSALQRANRHAPRPDCAVHSAACAVLARRRFRGTSM